MIRWIKKMFWRCYNNRILRYIYYGGLTTLVNLGVYYLLRLLFHVDLVIANIISVAVAILFAYFVNSRFVFETKAVGFAQHFEEFLKFVGARITTMVIEVGGVWFMAEVMRINDLAAKFVIQIVILVLNYIFSKFLIFRREPKNR